MTATANVQPLDERRKENWRVAGEGRPPSGPARIALTLPRIREALRGMTREEVTFALRERIVPVAWSATHSAFAAGAKSARRAAKRGFTLEAVIDDLTLLKALQAEQDAELRHTATSILAERGPDFSASIRLTPMQRIAAILFGAAIAAGFVFRPVATAAVLGIFCALFFLLVIGLKFMTLWPPPRIPPLPRLADDELPAYSVLVPLFRETEVAEQLLAALFELDYPAFGSKRTN